MNDFTQSALARARLAVAAIFFVNGAIIGSWAANIPLIKDGLGLSHGVLGLSLLAMAAGALVSMPIAGQLIGRFGSAAVVKLTGVVNCVLLTTPMLAPNLGLFVVALFLFGAVNGAMDVAMNSHGVAVETRLGKPIMSSLHAMFSVGGLIGAGGAAALLPLIGSHGHALVAGAVLLLLALPSLPLLLPSDVDRGHHDTPFAWPSRATLGLGFLAFLGMTAEGAILDWSGVYLRDTLMADASLAAAGFAVFSGAMAACRFLGDRLRADHGAVAVMRWSALAAAFGVTAAILVHQPLAALAGFAVAGFGIANVVPILFGAGGRTPGVAPGVGIAAITTLGYSGFLVGPPVIGLVADHFSLSVGLGLVIAALVIVAAAAQAVSVADQPA